MKNDYKGNYKRIIFEVLIYLLVNFLFRPLKMGRNFIFSCFSFFCFFFSLNKVPQVIIEMGRVIYHIEALSVVI